jgi:hypothetical protein
MPKPTDRDVRSGGEVEQPQRQAVEQQIPRPTRVGGIAEHVGDGIRA